MTIPPLIPVGLRCAHRVEPLDVAPDQVRFSWLLDGARGGRQQRAYQLKVARHDAPAGQDAARDTGRDAAWDSGRVESASSVDIGYGGGALRRGSRYRWQVRVFDERGQASDWSAPAWFEVELDPAEGWQAVWVRLGPAGHRARPPGAQDPTDPVILAMRPAAYLRRSFRISKPVASGRLRATALGLYEARLNGHRVGDAFLTPGWTDYGQRIQYQTYDVTGLLVSGENVLSAVIADGWYAGFVGFDAKRAGAHHGTTPELLAQLDISFGDGSTQRLVTDRHWRSQEAAIRHADLLMGERHDLRLEPRGWDCPGYDASTGGWSAVRTRPRDTRPLVADPGPPVRVIEEIAPASISDDAQGRRIVDFGQNLTGWLRIRIDAPAGTQVRVRHGEMLDSDGSLYTANLRAARQTDDFVCSGGQQVLEPRFTLHGFRYAEVSVIPGNDPRSPRDGYPAELRPADVVARVVHSDILPTGSFGSSADWLDRLFRCIDWGQRGNFISVPTDCPQRNERLGWLGDAQIFARTACYNRDVAAFFAKWLDDVADAQLPSGAFTDIAPRLFAARPGAPAWADAGVIVPWTVWKMYGDTSVLRRHFGAMSRWMDLLERDNPDYLRAHGLGNSYNDWLAPAGDDTPRELLATAYWAHDAALMAEICDAIGRPDDAAAYRALWLKVSEAFAPAFIAGDGTIESGTQTAYVLGLHMGLVPDEARAAAAEHLVAAIRAADWHLTTGFVGVGYLLPVLSTTGHSSVAYRLLEQQTQPSWRYMIDSGATTIWERWDGWSAERGFQTPRMNSFNHYALGSVGEWLYRFVLGIDQAPGTAGFSRPLLRPHPGGSLGWARGSYASVRGTISAGWERHGRLFSYRVELPPNVTATVCVPSGDAASVRDAAGGAPAAVAGFPGAAGEQEAVFYVGPGSHEFAGPAITGLA
jgi:alpha-L-rhamnosidase